MNCLILGAGLMQKPAILSAKEAGFKTCVVDADKNAVAIPYADEFCQIDLKDKEGILKYAQTLSKSENGGLAAVFTAGTDFSASVSYVCEKLKLPAHSYNAALNASVKTLMRQCFKDAEVPSPKFINASIEDKTEDVLKKVLSVMNYPFVIKPVDNMGARGCRMVRSENEFESSLKAAVSCSRTKNAIIEEYMEGPEYSIDAVVYNGSFTITGFAIRHIKYPPYFIEVGHTMPAVLEKKIHDELISVFALGAKSLGLSCGVAKADIKYTKKGPMIGEIAGRLSGGYMSGWTYPYSSDLNLTKQALLVAAGKEPEELLKKRIPVDYCPSELCKNHEKPYELYEVPSVRTCAERAWMSIPGVIKNIEDIEDFTDKAITDVLPRAGAGIGNTVTFPRNNVEKCGNIISVSHKREIAVEAGENAVSNIFITLEPCNPLTDEFLNGNSKSDEDSFPPYAFFKLSNAQEEELTKELSLNRGIIGKNQKTYDFIPELLKNSDYRMIKDWSYNTIETTLQKFDVLRKNHPELNSLDFFKAVLRGGLQGAVYYSDSLEIKVNANEEK